MMNLIKILIERRERIVAISLNEIKRRYVASFLGVFWTILEPVSIILIFSLVFPILLKASFKEWVIFFIAGLIPFRFLNRGGLEVVRSLLEYKNILEKMKIDKEEIILARTLSNFIYFLIETAVFLPIVAFFVKFSPSILLLPILFISSIFFVISIGFFLSLYCIKYRDVEYILNVLFQLLFFLAPTVYRYEVLPEIVRNFFILLPTSSIIYSFQSVLLQNVEGFKPLYPVSLTIAYSFIISLSLLVISYKLFMRKKYE